MACCVEEAREVRREGGPLTDVVRAAGGVVVRDREGRREVLLIRRARYGDWTLPKGKCDPGESDEDCALREVEEETGLACELLEELPSTTYEDGRGRAKSVRYWRMRVSGGKLSPAPPEIDEVRWLTIADAQALLTYHRDGIVLDTVRTLGSR